MGVMNQQKTEPSHFHTTKRSQIAIDKLAIQGLAQVR